MPVAAEKRAAIRDRVAEIRRATSCEICGAQPIEWHHADHPAHPARRIANMVARGVRIEEILAEIDRCEALCRKCHMREDGRLDAFKAMPRKGRPRTQVKPPCPGCGGEKEIPAMLCRRCRFARRRGEAVARTQRWLELRRQGLTNGEIAERDACPQRHVELALEQRKVNKLGLDWIAAPNARLSTAVERP